MLTERDKKALEFSVRHRLLAKYGLWVLPALFAIGVAGQLYAASVLAGAAGLGLSEIVELWLSDPSPHSVRLEALAVVRVERALGMLALTVLSVGMALAASIVASREQRMVALLKSVGAWK